VGRLNDGGGIATPMAPDARSHLMSARRRVASSGREPVGRKRSAIVRSIRIGRFAQSSRGVVGGLRFDSDRSGGWQGEEPLKVGRVECSRCLVRA
jgi:hypothetical protein